MFLSASLLAVTLAAAQATPDLPPLPGPPQTPPAAATAAFDDKGTAGVEFVFPGGGAPTVGVTYFVAKSVAARLDFGLDARLAPNGTPAVFSIGVALRFYQLKRGPVAIFLEPSFAFGRARITPAEAAEFFRFGGAVGAEYLFTQNLAIGGQLGLALALGNIGGIAGSSVIVDLTTATSGLFARLYF